MVLVFQQCQSYTGTARTVVIPVPCHQGFCIPSVWQPPERSSVASDLGEGIQRMEYQTGL